jgi:hypothetical protein
MHRLTRVFPIGALAAALAAGACSDNTAPKPVDPSAMAATVGGINASFSQNAVFQSLSALAESFTLAAPAARPSALLAASGSGAAWATTSLGHMRGLAARAPAAVMTLFPANVLGKTFVWDTAGGGRYRILDSTLTGASANGVRFRLYQADTATHRPVLPLTTTGFVDLVDASTPQANVLHQVLHVGSLTAADYTTTGVKTTGSLTLSVSGYVADVASGGSPVNLVLSHALTLADSSLVTDYQAVGNGATLVMHTTASGSGGNPTLGINWNLAKGGASIGVIGSGTSNNANLQFTFNGVTWATVTGDLNGTPVIAGANGHVLTLADLYSMAVILQGFTDVGSSLDAVFGPAYLVFK